MYRILIIEDDRAIRMGLEDDLRAEGYTVESATTGPTGLERAMRSGFDLILLDLLLPGMDGLDVCRELRRKNIATPIIMLTAKGQDIDKVIGLELGADDYLTKPFHSHELRARIRAVLRRTGRSVSRLYGQVITAGPFALDPGKYRLTRDGNEILLTTIEFELLRLMMLHPGEVLHRDLLLAEVWGNDVLVTPRTVDAHIAKLRRKIGDREEKRWIHSFRGVGYRFSEG